MNLPNRPGCNLKLRVPYIDLTKHLPSLRHSLSPPTRVFTPVWLTREASQFSGWDHDAPASPTNRPPLSFAMLSFRAFIFWLFLMAVILLTAWISAQRQLSTPRASAPAVSPISQ